MKDDAEKIFTDLVDNAIDFVEVAIEEVKQKSEYSIIHFYAAVGLVLKARILREHWTPVVSKKKDPNIDKFFNSDFQSISKDYIDVIKKKLSHRVIDCNIFGQESLDIVKNFYELTNAECYFVEDELAQSILITCPKCEKPVLYNNERISHCCNCGEDFNYNELMKEFDSKPDFIESSNP